MKKLKIIIPAILIFAVTIGVVIYTRPMTISEICVDIDVSRSETIKGYFRIAPNVEDTYFEITKEDPRFNQLIMLLQEKEFHKSIANILPQGTKTHITQDDDFTWELSLIMDNVELPDGNSISGSIIQLSNFFGKLELRFDGKGWHCTTNRQDEWLAKIMSLMSSVPN